jgi:hypothetical protein
MTEPTKAQDIGVARGGFLVAATGPDGSVEVVGKNRGLLWHASNGSGGWTSETVVDDYPNATGSLVRGPNGMVIFYCDGTNVVRADWTGSAWTVTPIRAGLFEGYGAVDVADVAHVGYMVRQGGTGIDDTYVAAPDATGPIATAPIVRPRAGGVVGSRIPTRIKWTGGDNLSGWATARVRQRTNDGSWTTIGSDLTASSVKRTLAPGSTTYAFAVQGTDWAGNTGDWATGPAVRLAVKSQANRMITYRGAWSAARASGYLGGSARTATSKSASATVTFTGRAFAWIGKYGPGYGSARIWVDGVLRATVSSHRKRTTYRPIVWSIAWSTSATHTIVIKPAGTAGHPRIVIDGIVTVR